MSSSSCKNNCCETEIEQFGEETTINMKNEYGELALKKQNRINPHRGLGKVGKKRRIRGILREANVNKATSNNADDFFDDDDDDDDGADRSNGCLKRQKVDLADFNADLKKVESTCDPSVVFSTAATTTSTTLKIPSSDGIINNILKPDRINRNNSRLSITSSFVLDESFEEGKFRQGIIPSPSSFQIETPSRNEDGQLDASCCPFTQPDESLEILKRPINMEDVDTYLNKIKSNSYYVANDRKKSIINRIHNKPKSILEKYNDKNNSNNERKRNIVNTIADHSLTLLAEHNDLDVSMSSSSINDLF